jgi:cytoplasmic iron level regulating protein YaaA (DUF328/UPF0246 family)
MKILIITSCSARKDDSVPILEGSKVVQPSYYLDDESLIMRLNNIRERVFQDPRANVGLRTTYALDLYVRAGNAYRELKNRNYYRLKSALLSSNTIEWFFLSGGYGVIHALEAARKYQATFNRNIAYQSNIPYTAKLWNNVLPTFLDAIISKFNPQWVYVFGSQDYTNFVKQTNFWKGCTNVKIFESKGYSGPIWLSPIINECVESILSDKLESFNNKYPRLLKQR